MLNIIGVCVSFVFVTHTQGFWLIVQNCTMLYKKGYSDIVMVVGSDRVREFDTIIKKYNDKAP